MPQLTLTIHPDRAALLDLPVAQIFSSLQTAFGGTAPAFQPYHRSLLVW